MPEGIKKKRGRPRGVKNKVRKATDGFVTLTIPAKKFLALPKEQLRAFAKYARGQTVSVPIERLLK